MLALTLMLNLSVKRRVDGEPKDGSEAPLLARLLPRAYRHPATAIALLARVSCIPARYVRHQRMDQLLMYVSGWPDRPARSRMFLPNTE